MMGNQEIARIFAKCAEILSIQGESRQRIMAYERAAEAIGALEQDVADVWRMGKLTEIPGIGDVLAAKIEEMLTTGKLSFYERLKTEVPPGVVEMLLIPGVGPKTAARFWNELGVTTIDALAQAARTGRVQKLARMGARSEAKLLEGIESLYRWSERTPLGTAWYLAHDILPALKEIPGVQQVAPVGGVRRMCDMVERIDLLVAAADPKPVIDQFRQLYQTAGVLTSSAIEAIIRTSSGPQAALHVVDPMRWGTALQHLTGSQAHNTRLYELARKQGFSMSEHTLRRADGSEVPCPNEEDVYRRLGLPWIPPELREGQGEIEAALAGALPQLVERRDLQGDLQMHTTNSDGHQSLSEMAQAARAIGMRYILITDHSHSMAVAGGQTIEELHRQRAAIDAVDAQYDDLRILAGSEVEIRADGTLDYPDDVLAELDIVVASLHTGLRSGRERTTERMLAAIHNPQVDIIAHPTGRLIGRREGADLDMEAILQAAAEMDTAIEINAHPDRLDLADHYVRRAVELGVKLAINSDAHDVRDFGFLFFGVAVARRGWASAAHIINTWDVEQLLSWARERASPQ
jgi:DNA polymerase (family 10)